MGKSVQRKGNPKAEGFVFTLLFIFYLTPGPLLCFAFFKASLLSTRTPARGRKSEDQHARVTMPAPRHQAAACNLTPQTTHMAQTGQNPVLKSYSPRKPQDVPAAITAITRGSCLSIRLRCLGLWQAMGAAFTLKPFTHL